MLQEAGSDGVMVAVVGNKEDMREHRRVDLTEANRLAKVPRKRKGFCPCVRMRACMCFSGVSACVCVCVFHGNSQRIRNVI